MPGIVVHPCSRASRATRLADRSRWRLAGCSGISRHEQRVAAIAVKLFDLLAPQHRLTRKFRKLLHLAALLHDAGRVYDADGHEHSGAAMVLADRSLPISPRLRRCIAYLVRYHRGPVPSLISQQQILQCGDQHQKLRLLLGILRASDAIDSRHIRRPTIIMKRTAKKLRITCLVKEHLAEARRRLGGRDKFELLEEELGLRVRLRIKEADVAE